MWLRQFSLRLSPSPTGHGNIAGVVVGPLTGWIVDRTGHFGSAFSVCAGIEVFGGICWVLLVGRLEQTVWLRNPQLTSVATEAPRRVVENPQLPL